MNVKERNDIQQKWTNGLIKVVVATVAFGMGIDLAHVRYVVHWTIPKSVEGFYQESGRAGRDGRKSKSILYYSNDDASKFQFLIKKAIETKATQSNDGYRSDKDHERSMNALKQMIEYCTQPCCRRQFLLRHFGEESDPRIICKKTCDYCIDPNCMERVKEKSIFDKVTRDIRAQQQILMGSKKFDYGGDSFDYDSHDEENELENHSGLGITKYDASCTSISSNIGDKVTKSGFKSANEILSHYEVSLANLFLVHRIYR